MAERRSSASSNSRALQFRSSRSSNPDIFSDEYALDSLQLSNGFRPQGTIDVVDGIAAPTRQRPVHPEDPVHISLDRHSSSRKRDIDERNSSLLSRQDVRHIHSNSGRTTTPSDQATNTVLDRSTSRASTLTFPRTQSPYQGATGPSQPYAMYPQDVGFSRSPSMATTSTVRPRERSYAGPTGPTQPYGMYSQNTVPEDDVGNLHSLPPPASVGFPGRSQGYRRNLGPGAEDVDDLIGPDGYTEQLPPYTRYPDDVPPKEAVPASASILDAARGDPGMTQSPTMNPFHSRESLHEPDRSINQHAEQPHNLESTTAVASSVSSQRDEGGNFKERVKEQGRRRICCGKIPFWVLAVLVLLMIAVLAGTIGGVVGNARGEQHVVPSPPKQYRRPETPAAQSTIVSTITTTSLVDATPLASTPTNLPTLPTGSFFVPLRNLSISRNSCLEKYRMAWNCADEQDLKLDLSVPGSISISPRFPARNNQVRFGPQLPQLDQPIRLQLMGDRDGLEKGPAWWFQQPYTKVVVVRRMDFDEYGEGNDKRWFDFQHARKEKRQNIAPVSSKPWFCYWNNTILEGFIYVTQNFSGQYQPVSSEYVSSSSPTSDPEAMAADNDNPSFEAYPPLPTGSTLLLKKRTIIDPTQLAAYSKDIKIEERRAPNTAPAPYCVHMQVMNDGSASPLPDESGNPQIRQLTELPSAYGVGSDQPGAGKEKRVELWERGNTDGSCECEWTSN